MYSIQTAQVGIYYSHKLSNAYSHKLSNARTQIARANKTIVAGGIIQFKTN